MATDTTDRKFMEIAIDEMRQSRSEHVSKVDPMVGVVLVDARGVEIARAHRGNFSAGDHAEFTIFEKMTSDTDAFGGTLYVTLEPCTGREQPKKPCAQRIVEKGIARVVIGIRDPNPEIYKRGVAHLTKHRVLVDFFDEDLAEEIRRENREFIGYMERSRPVSEAKVTQTSNLETPSLEEERPIPEASIEDLSEEAIRKYLKHRRLSHGVPSEELWSFFSKSKFVVERGGKLVPTLAGIVLFGNSPAIFQPEHSITVEKFTGTPEDGISIERLVKKATITGPLGDMVRAIERFYRKFAAKVPLIQGFQRVEGIPEYPEKVIREAIVNALVHRDYSVGANISLQMFRDRIIVKSPGLLLRPNTLERVRSFDVTPVRRNRRIAEAAFHLKLMEKAGYGIRNMPARLNEYGLRPPDFDYQGGYFVVILYGREKSPITYRIHPEQRAQLGPRQMEILNLIWELGRVTSEECTKKFGITRETANQDFRHLVELGLIQRKGKGRATHYILVA